ncbi:MAG TPA: ABC transporter permease [Clostridia bacterium]|nr:ABC transporter permease [Clostridia bacterium]
MFKTKREPLFHLTKRTEVKKVYAWAIRIGAFVLSILVCAIVSAILTEKSMGFFFKYLIDGTFGNSKTTMVLFYETGVLLLVALAVTPCFKMRFWNIGGEGQILMGALGCGIIVYFMGGKYPDGLTIFVSLLLALVFSITWAAIPAIFKAKWNTNETLLTLMMNYIAICLVEFFIKSVIPTSTGILMFDKGIITLSSVDMSYLLVVIIAIIITVLMWIYLKFSKHGYELTVVGESEKTSQYIGLNTKGVIVRTLVLCGFLCGTIGFLLVSSTNHALGSATVSGRGFTGVLVSWLAQFNPFAMALTSFLVVFIDKGASQVGNYARLGMSYPQVMTGIFFFFIISTEFFINYKIVFRSKKRLNTNNELGDFDKTVEVLVSTHSNDNTITKEEA